MQVINKIEKSLEENFIVVIKQFSSMDCTVPVGLYYIDYIYDTFYEIGLYLPDCRTALSNSIEYHYAEGNIRLAYKNEIKRGKNDN